MAADANAFRGRDGNPLSDHGGRRSSSVPVTSMRFVKRRSNRLLHAQAKKQNVWEH